MGKKKDAALHGLSKKERKKAEARAAEIAAELERRAAADKKADKIDKKAAKKALANSDRVIAEDAKKAKKKASKKASKKGKGKKPAPAVEPVGVEAEAIAAAKEKRSKKSKDVTPDADLPSRSEVIEAADKVLASAGTTDAARAMAQTAKDAATEASEDETNAQIRERVQRKRAAREALEAEGATIDRADADAVREYNKRAVAMGVKMLTSDEERERIHAKLSGDVPAEVVEKVGAAVDAIRHEVEAVETEHGREFAAGPATADDDFAKPSEAPRADFEVNGNGQYKVKRPSDGKIVGYTRVTTYIDAIEDSSRLVLWKLRTLLEGVAAAAEPGEREDAISTLRDLAHRRDAAIAKAHKKDRKGNLEPGELAQVVDAANRDFRNAVDKLADELLELGGARDKANKGTDLHALFEIVDRDGLPAIHSMRQRDEITASDVRDCIAYADAIATLGAKIIDVERVIVNDAVPVPRFLPLEEYGGKPPKTVGVAGRLDRTALVRLPGRQRAGRYVLDVKTGSLEWSAGKIARQLHMYANAVGYDLTTHEREDLKLDKKTALVVHVPAGTGRAYVYAVDLTIGGKGNKVAADVRAMRNEGKKAIDLDADLLEIIRTEEAPAEEA